MLSLPQTSSSQGAIPVSENVSVIGDLLSTVGAIDPLNLNNIDLIGAILCAADKYDFARDRHDAHGVLEKEVQFASSRTLALDLLSPEAMAELVALESEHRDKLVALHRRGRDAFTQGPDDDMVFYANLSGAQCKQSISSGCTAPLGHDI
ncbi:hypothetical protein GSI_06737 [Ganoderma sinense ZZ0214-1]|uniref:Uncharacterized protein n=1 Tax=Ganoderma sinense ZZ0214-1 TaxID=1077348 RepID=A0A2G8SE54_9APHY|nr:hypothetical protein GSI_06737 [Ganoderma sinense ZZ0214-1]